MKDKTVLVLGAGINGAAIARELLLNRIPVCLVDRQDIAGGTTAYSSRLIHGGLRYLEYGEFGLVRESVDERERLLRLAPQFVRPLRLFIPVERRTSGFFTAASTFLRGRSPQTSRHVSRGLWLVRTGLGLYDLFARRSSLPRHRVNHVSDSRVPPVSRERFRWLCSYHDAQIEFPERFVVAMLEDARRLSVKLNVPFEVFTYHQVDRQGPTVTVEPSRDYEGSAPRLPTNGEPENLSRNRNARRKQPRPCTQTGSVVTDGKTFQPAAIVNATGAWVDRTLTRLRVDSPALIGGTKGSHLFTRNAALRAALADSGVYAEASDGRPVFLLPFGPFSLVGTTDLPTEASPETEIAGDDELNYLLSAIHDVFPHIDLTREDIDIHYCGVRPLPKSPASSPASITRRHLLHESEEAGVPLISVIGGKLTTCRSLAEEATQLVMDRIGLPIRANSRTRPIPGGEHYPDTPENVAEEQSRLADEMRLSVSQVAAVWKLCGTRTASMLASNASGGAERDDMKNLPGTDLPERFVRRVIRDEWCADLGDLVERRLMLLFAPCLSVACLHRLARLMVEEGLVAESRIEPEITRCIERLRTHFGRTIQET